MTHRRSERPRAVPPPLRARRFAVALASLLPALGAVGAPAGTRAADDHDDLDDLVATALAENPQLTAIEAQIAALEHEITVAGAWKNPMLSVAYQNAPVDSFAMGEEPMTMVMIRLEQTIPFPGKTGDREDVARMAADAQRHALDDKRAELRAMVRTAYYRLALARHLRDLTEDHVDLVDQLIDAVRIKYEVGRAPQQNLLRLQVLRGRLADDLEDFTQRERELTAALNATLHRDPGTPIATPEALEVVQPALELAALREMALESRPMLAQLDATAAMHRAAADLAEYEAFPDPTLFASYGIRTAMPNGAGGRDLVTFGVGLPLPVFYPWRNAASAAKSREQARAAEANRDAAVDTIDGGLGQALAAWRRAAAKVQTYRDQLVPGAHRTLDATFAAYQVDRADFLSLYEAELDLLSLEKTIRMATVEALVARATVERLIGRTLP